MRILIAGALPRRLQRLRRGLLKSHHQVKTAQTNAHVWQTVMRERVDTIVLDTTAPSADLEPWRLCAELRQATSALLIALTRKGQNQDRVRAFRAGAFQCLTMPVSPTELAACLDSVPRPARSLLPDPSSGRLSPYSDPVLQIDLVNRLVRRDGAVHTLTPREAVLLQCLLMKSGRIVLKEDLCDAVWVGTAAATAGQRLKMHISALRQKLESDPKHPAYIISERGRGYAFIPQMNPGKSKDQPQDHVPLSLPELAAFGAGVCDDGSGKRNEGE